MGINLLSDWGLQESGEDFKRSQVRHDYRRWLSGQRAGLCSGKTRWVCCCGQLVCSRRLDSSAGRWAYSAWHHRLPFHAPAGEFSHRLVVCLQ